MAFTKKHVAAALAWMIWSLNMCLAQNPALVADLNTDTVIAKTLVGSSVYVLNNAIYFDAIDNSGMKIWRSDGTAPGTVNAIDPAISNKGIELNGYFIYGTDNNSNFPNTLWKTDGTQAGTSLITTVSAASNFINLNGTIYFSGTDAAHGAEIWKTDGTPAGTQLVFDMTPGTAGTFPFRQAAVINNKIVFTVEKYGATDDVYITDGTAAGTQLLIDMDPSDESYPIRNFVLFNNALYFVADEVTVGPSLWKTDGTTAGTVLVKDFDPNGNTYDGSFIVIAGNKMFMPAFDSHGRELWVSNGTAAGTKMVKNIRPGGLSAFEYYLDPGLWAVGNEVYFLATDDTGFLEPWRSDGSINGTVKVIAFNSPYTNYTANSFTGYNGKVIFTNEVLANKVSVYTTDGTSQGTQLLTTISVYADVLLHYNNKIFFRDFLGSALWQTDGTIAGTYSIKLKTTETASVSPFAMTKISDTNYFFLTNRSAEVGNYDYQVFGTKGSAASTEELITGTYEQFDICPVSTGSLGLFVAETAISSNTGNYLFATDGTAAGTVKIADLFADFSQHAVVMNGIVYFAAIINKSSYQRELWRTDGTAAGTYRVKNITPGGDDKIDDLTLYNSELYFAAQTSDKGVELWKSDGTDAGTVIVKDIQPGDKSSNPENLAVFNGKLYFAANNGAVGKELYVSDGTDAGTYLVKDIRTGTGNSNPEQITASSNFIYFVADDHTHGTELWRSDGTAAGTVLFEDLSPGESNSNIANLKDIEGALFYSVFSYYVPEQTDVRKITGSASASEVMVDGVFGENFNNINGDLYFTNYENELWRSNGSPCGTKLIDFFPEVVDESTQILLVDGSTIFLSLRSADYGDELYKYTTAPITSYEICNGIDDDCNGLIDDHAVEATITPSGMLNACDGQLVVLTANAGENLTYQWLYNGQLINGQTNQSISSTTLGGAVSVIVTQDLSCSDTSEATIVNRVPLPKAKITPLGSLDICAAGSVVLKANSGSGYAYQWQLNNTEIPGATKKQYTAAATGNYKVEVANADGCSKISKKVTVFSSCKLTENETASGQSIIACPNPFSNTTYIDLSKLNSSKGQVEVRITDLYGKILFEKTFFMQTQIEIGKELTEGFYLVEVKGMNRHEIIPIVKSN